MKAEEKAKLGNCEGAMGSRTERESRRAAADRTKLFQHARDGAGVRWERNVCVGEARNVSARGQVVLFFVFLRYVFL